MNFLDGHLFPENQQPLIITAAPYAPSWLPSDFPGEIAVTMDEQIQKAVDCYEAGATVLHLHVRELDGKGSKRLSKFNELIAGVRARVPDMIIQVGGSNQLRARERRRGRPMAERRHAPHARRAGPQARPGDGDDQYLADEHPRAVRPARHRGHVDGGSRGLQRLQGDDRPRTAGLGRGAHPPPVRGRHPERLPVLQHQQLRVGGAAHAPRHLHRQAARHDTRAAGAVRRRGGDLRGLGGTGDLSRAATREGRRPLHVDGRGHRHGDVHARDDRVPVDRAPVAPPPGPGRPVPRRDDPRRRASGRRRLYAQPRDRRHRDHRELFRVSMLTVVVIIVSAAFKKSREAPMAHATTGRTPARQAMVPWFLWLFVAMVALNSLGFLSGAMQTGFNDVSRACLVTAIAALGMKTSFAQLARAGWRPLALIVVETVWIAGFVLTVILIRR